jgi:hypothetical protein
LRNVGIHNSTESNIIVGKQKVNADEFVQYLDTDEPVRAIISTKTKSNEKGLANAVKSLYYRVMSNTGTREAYTNFAYSKLIRDGIDVSKMTNTEFQQALAQIAAKDLMDRAKDFIMSEYGDKITVKTSGSTNGIPPQDKESVEIDAVKIAQAKPDKVTRVELGIDPIEGKIHTFDFFSSTVPNTTNFYMSGRIGAEKGAPPVTDYNFLNNFNIGNVAYGDLNLGTILPTGDPVVSIITSSEYGKSLAAAVPHIGKEARILFSVPCSIDKDNDVPKVEFDYLVQENILQNELHKQLKKKKQEWQKKGLTDEQIFKEYMQLKKDVSTLLAKQSPAFREYKENKVLVGLGTDGACSNNSLNMLNEMKVACLLQKWFRWNACEMIAKKALDLATLNNAKILGLNAGSIEEGKVADILLLDKNHLSLLPSQNIISNIVYSCSREAISDLIVNGKFVMKNRTVLTLDEEKVKDEFKNTVSKLIYAC